MKKRRRILGEVNLHKFFQVDFFSVPILFLRGILSSEAFWRQPSAFPAWGK